MKYKLTPKERYKPVEYLISRDEKIIWATENYRVWLGETVVKFLEWVRRKDAGICTVIGVECTVPSITRSNHRSED